MYYSKCNPWKKVVYLFICLFTYSFICLFTYLFISKACVSLQWNPTSLGNTLRTKFYLNQSDRNFPIVFLPRSVLHLGQTSLSKQHFRCHTYFALTKFHCTSNLQWGKKDWVQYLNASDSQRQPGTQGLCCLPWWWRKNREILRTRFGQRLFSSPEVDVGGL